MMTIRKILHYLFGWQYVVLFSNLGNITIARAHQIGGRWFVRRVNLGVWLTLQPDGRATAGDYSETWEPLTDGISRDFPATQVPRLEGEER